MASRTERHRVLTGGMELVPPDDKLNPASSRVLDNFRVDNEGMLWSRAGVALEGGPAGSGKLHTLARVGDYRYTGIGNALYWGLSADYQIIDGFDGNRLGMAFYQGKTWVMNRGRRALIDTFQAYPWCPDPPATAPVLEIIDNLKIDLETYDASDGKINARASQNGTDWIDVVVAGDPQDHISGV